MAATYSAGVTGFAGTDRLRLVQDTGIAYALGAMLFFGLGDLVYKRAAAAGVPAHRFLMVQTWFFAPSVVLYGLATGSLTFAAGSLWGAFAGVFAFAGFYNFAHSLRRGSISINAPIFRLSFVVTAALAVLILGEPLGFPKLAGIALALAAAWLLLGAPVAAQSASLRRETRASLARVLIATAAVGVANFIYKIGIGAGATPASLLVAQAAVVVLLSTAMAARLDAGIRPAAALRHAPYAAIALALAFAFMVESLAGGEASVMVPIAQMGFVVTALVGFAFMGEAFSARRACGLLAAAAALACLAYGSR
jgi:drug/metabolite transporter (DMT)-like permease